MVLHLEPDAVDLAAAVDEPDRTVGRVLLYPMPTVTKSGVVGAPSGASAQRGAELFERLVDAVVALLTAARSETDQKL